ncbi:MAG: transcriptional regulator [Devosia sp.]|nr:transcriptional regulator [Devosia sp.]
MLEARIVSGELADGGWLPPERNMVAEFGVSRTVAREAVATLVSRGLIENRPRFRRVVRKPGYDAALFAMSGVAGHLLAQQGGVKNLYDTRIFLEAALVRNAALNARKHDLAALREALELNRGAIPDSDQFYVTDIAFHAVFYQVSGNPVFPAVHAAFVTWLSGHWRQMLRSPERNQVNYFSHREIYNAVLDRDPDAAEKALTGHLTSAWQYVRSTFEVA